MLILLVFIFTWYLCLKMQLYQTFNAHRSPPTEFCALNPRTVYLITDDYSMFYKMLTWLESRESWFLAPPTALLRGVINGNRYFVRIKAARFTLSSRPSFAAGPGWYIGQSRQARPAAISDLHYLDNSGPYFQSWSFISPIMDGRRGRAGQGLFHKAGTREKTTMYLSWSPLATGCVGD